MTRQKLLQIETELKKSYFEREEEVHGSILALLARQHVLLLGPPGTAKSQLVEDLCGRTGGIFFSRLLTKFSTPEELFGPISLKGLEQDKYMRITTGKLPEAQIAFLDEIWKASSSILNTLLRIVNERMFDNGNGSPIKVPLQSMFGASNEMPESGQLSALDDRFLFRFVTQYIASPQNFVNMLAAPPSPSGTLITMGELTAMQADSEKIVIPDEVFVALVNLREILKKESIIASDRRYKQSLSLIRANAYLSGRPQASVEDLALLKDVLWSQPSEYKTVRKLVLTTVNPTLSQVQELLDMAQEVYHQAMDPNLQSDAAKANAKALEASAKLRNIQEELGRIKPNPATDAVVLNASAKVKTYSDDVYNSMMGIKPKA
nr:MAG: AAA family ATPase [Candidatus Methanoperedens sp.]